MNELLFDNMKAAQKHGIISLPNAESFENRFFSAGLTTYSLGWRDPNNLEAELEFLAPAVDVPRKFQFRKFDNSADFLTDSDDAREVGADFKRVTYSGTLVDSRTINRGLTIHVDLDEVGDDPNWQERYTGYLLRRSVRNDLVTAATLAFAGATAAPKTWGTNADPDGDLMEQLDLAGEAIGFSPNRIYAGSGAWSKRVRAFRAQNNAGAYASARMTKQEVADQLEVEAIFVSRARYQSSATGKTAIAGQAMLLFQAESGGMMEDPSHIKRFVSRCADGSMRRVYVREVTEKLRAITVERYVNTTVVSTVGLRKLVIT